MGKNTWVSSLCIPETYIFIKILFIFIPKTFWCWWSAFCDYGSEMVSELFWETCDRCFWHPLYLSHSCPFTVAYMLGSLFPSTENFPCCIPGIVFWCFSQLDLAGTTGKTLLMLCWVAVQSFLRISFSVHSLSICLNEQQLATVHRFEH